MSDMAEKRRQQVAAQQNQGPAKPPTPAQEKPPEPEPEPAAPARKPPALIPEGFTPPPSPGPCNSCGNELTLIPVNSRVRAWACTNHHCSLYRERVQTFSVPAPAPKKPKAKKAKAKGGKTHGSTNSSERRAEDTQKGRR